MTPRVVVLGMVAACTALLVVGGCSKAEKADPLPLPEVPEYTRLTHPHGVLMSDLRAWEATLPLGRFDELKDCDAPYQVLLEKSGSKEEIARGVLELLDQDATKYHQCFYLKLNEITREVDSSEKTIQERQKQVIRTYAFLSALGRGFQDRFKDTRYRRWAMSSYKKHSERVFFRRLETTPEATSEMVSDSDANGFTYYLPERQPQTQVLEKYGLVEKRAPASVDPKSFAPTSVAPMPPPIETAPAPDAAADPFAVQPAPLAPEAVADPNIPAAPIATPPDLPPPSVVDGGEVPPPLDP